MQTTENLKHQWFYQAVKKNSTGLSKPKAIFLRENVLPP